MTILVDGRGARRGVPPVYDGRDGRGAERVTRACPPERAGCAAYHRRCAATASLAHGLRGLASADYAALRREADDHLGDDHLGDDRRGKDRLGERPSDRPRTLGVQPDVRMTA
jgi:hypothetical protein